MTTETPSDPRDISGNWCCKHEQQLVAVQERNVRLVEALRAWVKAGNGDGIDVHNLPRLMIRSEEALREHDQLRGAATGDGGSQLAADSTLNSATSTGDRQIDTGQSAPPPTAEAACTQPPKAASPESERRQSSAYRLDRSDAVNLATKVLGFPTYSGFYLDVPKEDVRHLCEAVLAMDAELRRLYAARAK